MNTQWLHDLLSSNSRQIHILWLTPGKQFSFAKQQNNKMKIIIRNYPLIALIPQNCDTIEKGKIEEKSIKRDTEKSGTRFTNTHQSHSIHIHIFLYYVRIGNLVADRERERDNERARMTTDDKERSTRRSDKPAKYTKRSKCMWWCSSAFCVEANKPRCAFYKYEYILSTVHISMLQQKNNIDPQYAWTYIYVMSLSGNMRRRQSQRRMSTFTRRQTPNTFYITKACWFHFVHTQTCAHI